MRVRSTNETTIERSKELRKKMSLPERMLWSRLRANRIGYVVRRQYPHGPYIMDFYVHEIRLCIEIDGADHEWRDEHDAARYEYMREHGLRTVRYSAKGVLEDPDGVAMSIYHLICEATGRDPLNLRA